MSFLIDLMMTAVGGLLCVNCASDMMCVFTRVRYTNDVEFWCLRSLDRLTGLLCNLRLSPVLLYQTDHHSRTLHSEHL